MKKSVLPTVLVAELIQAQKMIHEGRDKLLRLNSEWLMMGSRARDEKERDYRDERQNEFRDRQIKQWQERQTEIESQVASLTKEIECAGQREAEINKELGSSEIQPALQAVLSLTSEVTVWRDTPAMLDIQLRDLFGAKTIDSDETIAAINRLLALKAAAPVRLAIREEELQQASTTLLRVTHAHISQRLSPKLSDIRERLTAKLTEKFEPLYQIEAGDRAEVRQHKAGLLAGAIASSTPMHDLSNISRALTIRDNESAADYAASILDLGEMISAFEVKHLS